MTHYIINRVHYNLGLSLVFSLISGSSLGLGETLDIGDEGGSCSRDQVLGWWANPIWTSSTILLCKDH